MSKPTPKSRKASRHASLSKSYPTSRSHSNVSTSTKAQEQRVLDALRRGSKTTDQLRQLGCYQVSARIFGLRAKGYVIHTDLFNGVGADGFVHARMARYSLFSSPGAAQNRLALRAGRATGSRNHGERA